MALKNIKPSSQSDYPVLKEFHHELEPNYSDLEKLAVKSDVVALVKVSETYDKQSFITAPTVITDMRRVDVRVSELIRGEDKSDLLYVWQEMDYLPTLPELKKGDELILFLNFNSDFDGYTVMTPAEGYFYLAEDDKVYPARVTEKLKEVSGMNYMEFKKRVENA